MFKKPSTCPMLSRSDWGVGHINQRGFAQARSKGQSTVGFHGPKTAGWLVFKNGAHRGEDLRIPVGDSRIGSSWLNDLTLTGVGVGSLHAYLKCSQESCTITAAAASREVRINNKPINGTATINDGDLVTLGELHATFRFSEKKVSGYIVINNIAPEGLSSQTIPSVVTCGWLVIASGPNSGQDYRLVNGLSRVGSRVDLEISLADPKLDSEIFTIECAPGKGCRIASIIAGKAVKVNGAVVETNHILRDSDLIAVDHMETYLKWL